MCAAPAYDSRLRGTSDEQRAVRLHPAGRQRRVLHRPCLGQGARAADAAAARAGHRARQRPAARRTTPCWWRTTTSTATCRTWRWPPAAASPIRWRWRASAATMRPRRWSWPACASWARPRRSCRRDKRVLMPDLEATCSLDLGCPADDFGAFCDAHPDRKVVVYANTSAAVKARADWMVTSSCALAIVAAPEGPRREDPVGARPPPGPLHPAADRRRHAAVERRVHRARRVQGAGAGAAAQGPPAGLVLVHPESPEGVVRQADVVGSTSQLLKAVIDGTAQRVHRRHRQRHHAPHAPAGAGQDADRGADRRQQCHLQELRALPVDGDERTAGRGRLPRNRRRRDRGARARAQPCAGLHRAHARLRQGASGQRRPAAQRLRAEHRGRPDAVRTQRVAGTGTPAQHRRRAARRLGRRRLDRRSWYRRAASAGPGSGARRRSAVRPRLVRRRVYCTGCQRAHRVAIRRRRATCRPAAWCAASRPIRARC